MDRNEAVQTIEGLKETYDKYTKAFQMAVDTLNGQLIVIDSEKAQLQVELDIANTTIADLQAQILLQPVHPNP